MIKRPCQKAIKKLQQTVRFVRPQFCNNAKNSNMKKLLLSLAILCAISFTAAAQTEVKANDKKVKIESSTEKTKIKKTSTPGQKVHNLIHRKHKKYSGVKVKHEAKKED